MSILSGVDELIDKWCGLSGLTEYGTSDKPGYFSRKAAIDLSEHKGPLGSSGTSFDTTVLLKDILKLIAHNHAEAGGSDPADSVWNLEKEPNLEPTNPSPEVILERLVVILLGDKWSNQVPTASGLVLGLGKKRSIDLVHDLGNQEFEFIELKFGSGEPRFGSNSPLFAAWEVVIYGLLYAYARLQLKSTHHKPLLQARRIRLVALAPDGFYTFNHRGGPKERFDLAWLEKAINSGLESLMGPGLALEFEFQRFTKEFDAIYNEPTPLPIAVQAFRQSDLRCRERVYGA